MYSEQKTKCKWLAVIVFFLMVVVVCVPALVIGGINYDRDLGGNVRTVKDSMTVDACIENIEILELKVNKTFTPNDYCSWIHAYNERVQFQLSILYQMKGRLRELQTWYVVTNNKSIVCFDTYQEKYKNLKDIYLSDDNYNNLNDKLLNAYFIKNYGIQNDLLAVIGFTVILILLILIIVFFSVRGFYYINEWNNRRYSRRQELRTVCDLRKDDDAYSGCPSNCMYKEEACCADVFGDDGFDDVREFDEGDEQKDDDLKVTPSGGSE